MKISVNKDNIEVGDLVRTGQGTIELLCCDNNSDYFLIDLTTGKVSTAKYQMLYNMIGICNLTLIAKNRDLEIRNINKKI